MKIDLSEDFDFGFSSVNVDDIKKPQEDKVQKIYDMVIPLLKNLMKDSENEYIHWPNRKEKIEEFIKKLDKVKNGE